MHFFTVTKKLFCYEAFFRKGLHFCYENETKPNIKCQNSFTISQKQFHLANSDFLNPATSRNSPQLFPAFSRKDLSNFPQLSRKSLQLFPQLSRNFPTTFPQLSRKLSRKYPRKSFRDFSGKHLFPVERHIYSSLFSLLVS